VVVPALLGWKINQAGPVFLPFLVMLHVGTAVALLAYFWRDWLALALGAVGLADPQRVAESRRVVWLIVVATLPAVIVGGLLEHKLRLLFAAPVLVALFLVANGILLAVVERLRGRAPARRLADLRVSDALAIGVWQCLALIPGLSRSGATIAGGLLRGIDHEGAAHFSFLIATPIILGATVLEVPKLLHAGVSAPVWRVAVLAAVVSGVVAWISTAFLMRWFARNDRDGLAPFAWYCIAFGLGAFAWLRFGAG
jgi:undecaprenyl-diphosphatase